MNLIMFCYSFMRTKNILGFDKMLAAIKNWQPDYSKIVCALKTGFIKKNWRQNAPPIFNCDEYLFFKAAYMSL